MIITASMLKKILQASNKDNFFINYPLPRYLLNLHMHTHFSDGKMKVSEIFQNAQQYIDEKALDYVVVSITDHDDVRAQAEACKLAAKYPKIKYISGCELSVTYFDENLRAPLDFELLYYGLNPKNKALNNMLKDIQKNRIIALPLVFKELCERFNLTNVDFEDFTKDKANLITGKGCNFQYNFFNYFKDKVDNKVLFDFVFIEMPQKYLINQDLDTIIKLVKQDKQGFLSFPHPARLGFNNKLKNISVEDFLSYFLPLLKEKGVEGLEIYYDNYTSPLNEALERILDNYNPVSKEDYWQKIFVDFARDNNMLMTGGNDNHDFTIFKDRWSKVFNIWEKSKLAIKKGYKALNKEVTIGLPGPCTPAVLKDKDTGIGSPYGDGAKRFQKFFLDVVHKTLLGPAGKTDKVFTHSPYCSEQKHNPFFIPLEYMVQDKILSQDTLEEIYNTNKGSSIIDFDKVESAYNKAFVKLSAKKIENLAVKYIKHCDFSYIGDLQVMIPNDIYELNKDIFFEDFTLGTPPDIINPLPQNWNFKVIKPEYIFNANGSLGRGGKILYDIFARALEANKGGLRIDHFIGFVNPYLYSNNPNYENGRLYSSPHHPVLGKYAKSHLDDFGAIIEKIILKAAKDKKMTLSLVYPEDIGMRPQQLDYIMEKYNLGRLLVSEFVDVDDDNHIYRLKNAKAHDIATIDTHDTASLQDFISSLDDEKREKHARNLAKDLRFNYNDDLKSDISLFRMKWGELLTSPAHRIQAFFTSFIGQQGRYNEPDNPVKWILRCDTNFDINYFQNLVAGKAYNPFDAISLAIYARGDEFYEKYSSLVKELRTIETQFIEAIKEV